jgi:ubiquinone/menaquinone biosynthesis C-methylase UbiE/aryl carrier-like protein
MQAEIRRLDAQVDLFWRSEQELLREFGMRDGIDYLDCGCGPGRLMELVKSAYPATRCQGVEMDPILVQAAGAKLQARGFTDCKVRQGTAENPGLPEDAFDFITMRLVLEHVPDPVVALRSLGRLLRPGGRIFIISNDFENHTRTWPPVPELAALYDAYRTARRQDGGDPTIGRRVPQLLRRAGFKVIDQRVEVAHNAILGDETFLRAEGVGIPAELVSKGFLSQEVFESMIRNWKDMLAAPDHAITRQLCIAVGERLPPGAMPEQAEVRPAVPLQVALAPEPVTVRDPGNDTEARIAELWCRAMRVERVSVDRNFFDLGGDSLMLQEVHAGLREIGFDVQVATLFQYPTVETLAEFLSGGKAAVGGTASAAPLAMPAMPVDHPGGAGDDVQALARRRREALARRKPSGSG